MSDERPAHHLRFRQVHLDFHTSGDIPDVGARFSKRQFQEQLQRGRIDSVTLFSKCHHGYSYHPTAVGRMHPTLRRDLLGEQIEACREIGVRCPIYLSAGIDEFAAMAHPEWVVVDEKGRIGDPLVAHFKLLSFGSPYLDYLCAQIEEVVRTWPDNDGIFLDIVGARSDFSWAAMREMRAGGLDPARPADMALHAQRVLQRYYERTTAAARILQAGNPIFHNGGHIPVGCRRINGFNSHFELESLPTGGWGYDHFPISARYAITQTHDFLGMTGKFHGTWGEFGGFKRPAALRYECAAMLAQGAKCSVGDQLHPDGLMDPGTYNLIGAAYEEVAAKEAWADGVRHAARIALVSAEGGQDQARGSGSMLPADEGAARMLFELHLPFVVLDAQAGWDGFDLVVLPDGFRCDPPFRARAEAFLAGGGRILGAGSALLDPSGTGFAIDPGARLLGRSAFDPDYLVATDLAAGVAVRSAITIAGGAYDLEATSAEILAGRRVPYFNRTADRFCSHQHAPDAPGAAGPGAIIGRGVAYFAHDLFSQYRRSGQPLYRDFVLAALRLLLPDGLPAATSLPSGGRFNLLEQPAHRRYVAHLLYAPIALRAVQTRGSRLIPTEIIEELIPLRDVSVEVRVPRRIRSAALVPACTGLPFTQEGDRVGFRVPEFTGHQMVELTY